MAYSILISGTATREQEGKIAEALSAFVDKLEKIEGHGIAHAQFTGTFDYLRLRGEDTTLVETPGARDEMQPAIFRVGASRG